MKTHGRYITQFGRAVAQSNLLVFRSAAWHPESSPGSTSITFQVTTLENGIPDGVIVYAKPLSAVGGWNPTNNVQVVVGPVAVNNGLTFLNKMSVYADPATPTLLTLAVASTIALVDSTATLIVTFPSLFEMSVVAFRFV